MGGDVCEVEIPHGAVVLGAYFDMTPEAPSLVLVGAQQQPKPRGLVLSVLLELGVPAPARVRRFQLAKHGQRFEAPPGDVVHCSHVGNTNAQLFELLDRIEVLDRDPLLSSMPHVSRFLEHDVCAYCGRTVKACASDPCVGAGESGAVS